MRVTDDPAPRETTRGLKKFLSHLCKDDLQGANASMEERLYCVICLTAFFFSIAVILPANYVEHVPSSVDVIISLFALATLFFFLAARKGRFFPKVSLASLILTLNALWFVDGASQGSVIYYFFSAFMYILTFFRGRMRWLLFSATLLNGLILLQAEQFFPQWVVPFLTPQDRLLDLMIGILGSGICCAAMFWIVLSYYDRERSRLSSVNEELQRILSQSREADQELLKTKSRLDAIIKGTPDAVYLRDRTGHYLLANDAACQLLGRDHEEVRERGDEGLAQEIIRFFREGDETVLGTGCTLNFCNGLILGKGRPRSYVCTKGAVISDADEIAGVFGIYRDITEYHEVTERVRRLSEELDRRVVERTAQLERAIKEQEAFSYSVSHDLRTPLRHINSYTSILKEEYSKGLDAEGVHCLEQVCKASSHMGELIDDLLELARVSRSQLTMEPVDLSNLAMLTSLMLRQTDGRRNAEFYIEPGLTALGDRTLLALVIENLLSNAWKYTARKERARIEFGRELVEGKEVFFVKDNGTGFDMAYKDKLFGAFQRLHGREYEGTGIGLATVKRIIDRHQGSVWAEAEPDQGASFFFTLKESAMPPAYPGPGPWVT